MSEHLLTFELSEEKDELHVCADVNGLDFLIQQLSRLREQMQTEESEHVDLFTEEWGGLELSSESQIGEIINHVKIISWNPSPLPTKNIRTI